MMKALSEISIIWYREILRFWHNKPRIISSLAMPFLWLVMFGSGMSGTFQLFGTQEGGFDFIYFLFPGVIGMTVLQTSIFSSISVVRDREFGLFKEILAAPVSRTSITLGKILGGATTTTLQGMLMLVLAPLVGIHLEVEMILMLVPAIFLVAFVLASLGMVVASHLRSTESFQMIMSFFMMPMFFLSGALFPLTNVPRWMEILSELNPASYGVDLIRQIVFRFLDVPSPILDGLKMSVLGVEIGVIEDLIIVAAFALLFILLGIRSFTRDEG
jgi:ABC-2 type transport system permease protein